MSQSRYAFRKRSHQPTECRAKFLANFDYRLCEVKFFFNFLPALGENYRQHRGINRITKWNCRAISRQTISTTPPLGVNFCQSIDRAAGIVNCYANRLIDNAMTCKIFKHHCKLARLFVDFTKI